MFRAFFLRVKSRAEMLCFIEILSVFFSAVFLFLFSWKIGYLSLIPCFVGLVAYHLASRSPWGYPTLAFAITYILIGTGVYAGKMTPLGVIKGFLLAVGVIVFSVSLSFLGRWWDNRRCRSLTIP